METVTTYTVLLIELVWESVHVSVVRHCLVECCIEYTYLWNLRSNLLNGVHALEVCRVVEWCKVVASLEYLKNLVCEQCRGAELLTTMYHAVAYSVNLVDRTDGAELLACEYVEDEAYTDSVLWD